MSCILTILGKNLDIDAFLEKSKLKPNKKSYKGQPRFKSKPEEDKIPYSFLSIQTSNADFSDLAKQIKDTIRYLDRNKEKLAHIASTKEIQSATLDFGINLKIDRTKVLTQSEVFPSKLLKLEGNLGIDIELSLYPIDLQYILENGTKKKKK